LLARWNNHPERYSCPYRQCPPHPTFFGLRRKAAPVGPFRLVASYVSIGPMLSDGVAPSCLWEPASQRPTGVAGPGNRRTKARQEVAWMSEILEQPVFAAGEAQYTWADVLLASRAWGDRRKLVEQTRLGVACARHARRTNQLWDGEMAEAAADTFREERELFD